MSWLYVFILFLLSSYQPDTHTVHGFTTMGNTVIQWRIAVGLFIATRGHGTADVSDGLVCNIIDELLFIM